MTRIIFIYLSIIILSIACNSTKGKQISTEKGDEIVKLSISETLQNNKHLPIKDQVELYRKLRKESPNKYNFENEDELTMYGYSYLWDNKVMEAIEIFKLIVEQFPNSANPYDSLGEGYMANGEDEKAIANYRRSLELNPDNFNAEDQIERIKFPDKKPETFSDKFAKVYSLDAYKSDLDQLGKKLIEVNPSTLKFISEKDFWKTVEAKKALITERTTFSEFYWHCREIIANVNCTHTYLWDHFDEPDIPLALRFPMETRWVNNHLYVIDPLNNTEKVSKKDEVESINGILISNLMTDILNHFSSQGHVETSKIKDFNTTTTAIIPYALNFPKTYKIKLKGKQEIIELNPALTFRKPIHDLFKNPCDDNLCLEVLEGNKNAVLTISSFNYYSWNNLDHFIQFIDQSFKEIKEKNVENLIVDVRYNGGGSAESSIHLLKYLVGQPFTYFSETTMYEEFENGFKGKLFFLMDGNGKSTTGHFMAKAKVLNLGTIIGEELGSNQFCTAGQTICRLSNTKLIFYVANTVSKLSHTILPDETGILPDHYVSQSIDDYLKNIDSVKEFTIKLANE